jgi:hypothetical protein
MNVEQAMAYALSDDDALNAPERDCSAVRLRSSARF